MDRRSFCKTAGALGVVAGTAGCLGVLGDPGAEGAILGPPDQDLSEASFPSYGDEMPEFTVPDPIRNEGDRQHSSRGERGAVDLFLHELSGRGLSRPHSPAPSRAGSRRRGGVRRSSRVSPHHVRSRARHRRNAPRVCRPAGRRPRRGELALPPPGDLRAGPRYTTSTSV